MTLARKGVFSMAVLSLAIIAAVFLTNRGEKPSSGRDPHPEAGRIRPRSERPSPEQERSVSREAARLQVRKDWDALLKWIGSVPAPGAEEIRARLTEIRIAWTELDPQDLAGAIRDLLETRDDAATGIDFQVGIHGLLAGWPTLRVFLLDVLATSDPEMAMATAKKLLDTTASPDEFATGLRSLTRQGPGRADDGELLARFDQMLEHDGWSTSRGFAEAFDLARLIGTPDAARRLAAWRGNSALRSMAMDEFAAEHPEAMMEVIDSDPTVTGISRASLMARANPAEPDQLVSVDAYLRRQDLSNEEAEAFLKSFPLRSATTGYRLYGATPSPYTYEEIKAGDLAASELVGNWSADPELEKYRPQILSLRQRLSKWIEQAK
ncbi:MAG: hypothetical protein ABIS50_07065 [Luteolibacter sp.]|uniref:hypothetical protein n=1 Tax=Luteolibacter sp. TaxID=1962973 RepID=UPI003266D923